MAPVVIKDWDDSIINRRLLAKLLTSSKELKNGLQRAYDLPNHINHIYMFSFDHEFENSATFISAYSEEKIAVKRIQCVNS